MRACARTCVRAAGHQLKLNHSLTPFLRAFGRESVYFFDEINTPTALNVFSVRLSSFFLSFFLSFFPSSHKNETHKKDYIKQILKKQTFDNNQSSSVSTAIFGHDACVRTCVRVHVRACVLLVKASKNFFPAVEAVLLVAVSPLRRLPFRGSLDNRRAGVRPERIVCFDCS
jgi:hypothetical protein